MFKSVLVPLDGSPQAEQALPIAAKLARASQGSLLLVRVSTTLTEFGISSAEGSPWTHEAIKGGLFQATEYLIGITHSPLLAGLDVRTAIFSGSPADIIIELAQSRSCDLIVMNSHGDTGMKRLLIGSVSQKVVRQSTVPVLVLNRKAQSLMDQELGCKLHLLVGLDGSPRAEAIIAPAIQLCASLTTSEKSILHLISIVQPTLYIEDDGKAIANEMTATEVQMAQRYLTGLAQRIHEDGLCPCTITTSVIATNNLTADALVNAAEAEGMLDEMKDGASYPVIALATHGRRGISRLTMGSVIEQILGSTTYPLLTVRMSTARASLDQKSAASSLIG